MGIMIQDQCTQAPKNSRVDKVINTLSQLPITSDSDGKDPISYLTNSEMSEVKRDLEENNPGLVALMERLEGLFPEHEKFLIRGAIMEALYLVAKTRPHKLKRL